MYFCTNSKNCKPQYHSLILLGHSSHIHKTKPKENHDSIITTVPLTSLGFSLPKQE